MVDTPIDKIIFYVLIAFEILFTISFTVFFTFFVIRRRLCTDEYTIKKNFNDINKVSSMDNFTYLTILAEKNPQLNELMTDINNSKKFFEDQIKIVKEKIMCLSDENAEFSFKTARFLKNEINHDLQKCTFMSDKLRKVMSNTTTYSKNVSDLLTEYRRITDRIIDFYEVNLSIKYGKTIFVNIINCIEETLKDTSNYVLKIDNERLISSLNLLNKHIVTFYTLVKKLYALDRINTYLQTTLTNVNRLLGESKTISSNDQTYVEKTIAIATNAIKDLSIHLEKIEIDEGYRSAITAIKHIEDAAKTLSISEKSILLIQKSIKFIKEQFIVFAKKINAFQNGFEAIKKYFVDNDQEMVKKVDDLSLEFKQISFSFQSITQEYEEHFSYLDREVFLNRINEFASSLKLFKQKTDALLDEIISKYKDSINLINEIADLKLTLVQLLGMKVNIKSADESTITSIRTTVAKIDQFENMLSTDYFANYAQVYSEIQETKQQVVSIINSCSFDSTLKSYCQRLLLFLNKYRNEAPQIAETLDNAELAYKKNKYQDTIDSLIEVLQTIKYSSEVNKIKFN